MQYDFRDQEPVWVEYAEYVGGGSNKYYEIRIDFADDGLYVLTKRWGARPDTGKGQIKVETFTSLDRARGVADGQLASKLRKGYRECARPEAAGKQVVVDTDPEPTPDPAPEVEDVEERYGCIICRADVTDAINASVKDGTFEFACPACGTVDHI